MSLHKERVIFLFNTAELLILFLLQASSQAIVLAWTSSSPERILVESFVDSSTRFAILAVPNVPRRFLIRSPVES